MKVPLHVLTMQLAHSTSWTAAHVFLCDLNLDPVTVLQVEGGRLTHGAGPRGTYLVEGPRLIRLRVRDSVHAGTTVHIDYWPEADTLPLMGKVVEAKPVSLRQGILSPYLALPAGAGDRPIIFTQPLGATSSSQLGWYRYLCPEILKKEPEYKDQPMLVDLQLPMAQLQHYAPPQGWTSYWKTVLLAEEDV